MNRALAFVLLAGAVVSCGESGLDDAPVEGVWQLRTVNGHSLSAVSAALQTPMTGGVLRLVSASTWTEFCVNRGAGQTVWRRGGGFQDLGGGRGLVLYYSSSGAGTVPSDTLTVTGDRATFHFRQGAVVTDVLGFDRVAGSEMTPVETPSACP